jgi:basic amino acid/polyamine antiporter, APA family
MSTNQQQHSTKEQTHIKHIKIGFWTVLSLVIGSQIGSGIFISPTILAPYGALAFVGLILGGVGAISIALVFAKLCSILPKTGGPHVYVANAFGKTASFFTGWTYWVISWVSSIAIVKASIGYLVPIIGDHGSAVTLSLEISLLCFISYLNLRGLYIAGLAELFMTIIKIIPLVLVPIAAIYVFDANNFMGLKQLPNSISDCFSGNLGKTVIFAMWGFIGIETATTPADSVHKPAHTIPRAIIIGTLLVALVYLFNTIAVFGGIPQNILANSATPYADFARLNFGGNWNIIISLTASIVCIGTLHAWVLSAAQVSLGISRDGLMPEIFSKQNEFGAPPFGIICSVLGSIPLLIMTYSPNLAQQITLLIDLSVATFLFVYIACILAFFKIMSQRKNLTLLSFLYGFVAFFFCCWMLSSQDLMTLVKAFCFVLSGIPIFIWQCYYAKKKILKA